MGCHFLLQGIFPSQGSNPGLLHCRQTLYHRSHQGSLDLLNMQLCKTLYFHCLIQFSEQLYEVNDCDMVCVCVCVCAWVRACTCTELCLTLCSPIDCSPPGSSVHGMFQARILEWVAISFSRESSRPRD